MPLKAKTTMALVDFDPSFWVDEFTERLSLKARLLFIYLWTNPHHNHACFYKITPVRISFETGIPEDELDELFEELNPKVRRDPFQNLVWVVNYVKRQFFRRPDSMLNKYMKNNINGCVHLLGDHCLVREFYECYPILGNKDNE